MIIKRHKIISAAVILWVLIFSLSFFTGLNLAEAAELGGLDATGGAMGYGAKQTSEIPTIIGTAIATILALIGVVFMVLVWIGAFDIVGANGNEELVKKGKDRIKNGAIGILIVFVAYIFTKVVLMIVGGGGAFNFGF